MGEKLVTNQARAARNAASPPAVDGEPVKAPMTIATPPNVTPSSHNPVATAAIPSILSFSPTMGSRTISVTAIAKAMAPAISTIAVDF